MSSPPTSPKGRSRTTARPTPSRNRAVSPLRSPKAVTSPVAAAGKTPRARKVAAKKEKVAEAAPAEEEEHAAPAGPAVVAAVPAPVAAAPAPASPAHPAGGSVDTLQEGGDSPILVFAILGILGALVLYIVFEVLQNEHLKSPKATASVVEVDWTAVDLPRWPAGSDAGVQAQLAALVAFVQSLYQWSTTMDHWRALSVTLQAYVEANLVFVVTVYMTTYITLQSLAIPGSSTLSVLGGAVFGFWRAMLLVCICSSVGASFCYILSKTLLSGMVARGLGDRLTMWENEVKRNKETIFSYMLFLRVTPFFPNWFINLASPHVGVPLRVFFVATFIGVVPLSVIPILGGVSIQSLQDWSSISLLTKEWPYVNLQFLGIIVVSAAISLVPIIASQKRSSFAA